MSHLPLRPLGFAAFTLFAALVASSVACSSPRSLPCSNGAECTKADAKYSYCLESRCVECIGDASCGDGKLCSDGVCAFSCQNKPCPGGATCTNGICADG